MSGLLTQEQLEQAFVDVLHPWHGSRQVGIKAIRGHIEALEESAEYWEGRFNEAMNMQGESMMDTWRLIQERDRLRSCLEETENVKNTLRSEVDRLQKALERIATFEVYEEEHEIWMCSKCGAKATMPMISDNRYDPSWHDEACSTLIAREALGKDEE